MKKSIYVLFVFGILFMSLKSDVTLDQVLKSMIRSRGKTETISAIKDQVQIWTMSDAKNNTSKCIFTYKRPNKFRIEIKSIDGKASLITSIYDGISGTQTVFGTKRKMTQDELNEFDTKTITFIDGIIDYEKKGFSLKLLPDAVVKGINYHVIQSTDKYKTIQKLYCNAKTGVNEIIEGIQVDIMSLKKVPYKSFYLIPRVIDGISYPSKLIMYDKDNKVTSTFNLDKISNNTGVTDKIFY